MESLGSFFWRTGGPFKGRNVSLSLMNHAEREGLPAPGAENSLIVSIGRPIPRDSTCMSALDWHGHSMPRGCAVLTCRPLGCPVQGETGSGAEDPRLIGS